jgi:hypothetical protein
MDLHQEKMKKPSVVGERQSFDRDKVFMTHQKLNSMQAKEMADKAKKMADKFDKPIMSSSFA